MSNDYQAALEGATVFDLSDRGKIWLAGPDARAFLNNLCTQDVKNLPVGECREAFLTTAKARVIAHVWITQQMNDTLGLEMAATQVDKVLQHLNHHLISERVEITDRTQEYSMLRLVGPRVRNLGLKLGSIPSFRHDILGIEGFDVFWDLPDLPLLEWHVEAGAVIGTPTTYNLLRIEAGLPEYGIDIDENRLAMEVNRPQAISYTKGCYLGQETIVMARDRGQVNRLLMGVKVSGDAPLTPGAKLFRGTDEVGQVTSSVFSPRLGQVIALAYLRRGSWDPGTELVIDGHAATVCALPFSA